MTYRCFFFDADNTLLDYNKAEKQALSKALEHCGLPVNEAMFSLYRRINKTVWEEFEKGTITLRELRIERFRRFFDHTGIAVNPEEVSNYYLDRLSEGSYLIENAVEIVKTASALGACCIVTNGIAKVQRSRFSGSPLLPYLKGLVISEEVGSQKPHEGIFEAAMEMCGNPDKKDVLMIGDSLTSDILGGIRFGIDTCWLNPKGTERENGIVPTWEIQKLSELLPIIK